MQRPNIRNYARLQAVTHAAGIVRTIRSIRGANCKADEGSICDRLEAWLGPRALFRATRNQCAAHEAGHLIGFEATGMVAVGAEISGRRGWGGTAHRLKAPEITPTSPAIDLLHEAVVAVAGPLAEQLIADGDALFCIGEILETYLLCVRAAELSDRDAGVVLHEVLFSVAALIERHTQVVQDLADELGRRKRIHRLDRWTERILQRVRPMTIGMMPVLARSRGLICSIDFNLPSIGEFFDVEELLT